MIARPDEHRVLRPYDGAEACSTIEAANRAGKTRRTICNWVDEFGIGRAINDRGPISVSRVALQMLLDGDREALAAYLKGDRSSVHVVGYYDMLGLGHLIERWSRRAA